MGETAGKKENRWGWMPQFMPRVHALIAERRNEDGAEWVAHCWAQGVVRGEPGWWFAAEGSLAVGVVTDLQMLTMWHRLRAETGADAAVLILPPKPAGWTHAGA